MKKIPGILSMVLLAVAGGVLMGSVSYAKTVKEIQDEITKIEGNIKGAEDALLNAEEIERRAKYSFKQAEKKVQKAQKAFDTQKAIVVQKENEKTTREQAQKKAEDAYLSLQKKYDNKGYPEYSKEEIETILKENKSYVIVTKSYKKDIKFQTAPGPYWDWKYAAWAREIAEKSYLDCEASWTCFTKGSSLKVFENIEKEEEEIMKPYKELMDKMRPAKEDWQKLINEFTEARNKHAEAKKTLEEMQSVLTKKQNAVEKNKTALGAAGKTKEAADAALKKHKIKLSELERELRRERENPCQLKRYINKQTGQSNFPCRGKCGPGEKAITDSQEFESRAHMCSNKDLTCCITEGLKPLEGGTCFVTSPDYLFKSRIPGTCRASCKSGEMGKDEEGKKFVVAVSKDFPCTGMCCYKEDMINQKKAKTPRSECLLESAFKRAQMEANTTENQQKVGPYKGKACEDRCTYWGGRQTPAAGGEMECYLFPGTELVGAKLPSPPPTSPKSTIIAQNLARIPECEKKPYDLGLQNAINKLKTNEKTIYEEVVNEDVRTFQRLYLLYKEQNKVECPDLPGLPRKGKDGMWKTGEGGETAAAYEAICSGRCEPKKKAGMVACGNAIQKAFEADEKDPKGSISIKEKCSEGGWQKDWFAKEDEGLWRPGACGHVKSSDSDVKCFEKKPIPTQEKDPETGKPLARCGQYEKGVCQDIWAISTCDELGGELYIGHEEGNNKCSSGSCCISKTNAATLSCGKKGDGDCNFGNTCPSSAESLEEGDDDCPRKFNCCGKKEAPKKCEEKLGRYNGYCESGTLCGSGKGSIEDENLKDGDKCASGVCCVKDGQTKESRGKGKPPADEFGGRCGIEKGAECKEMEMLMCPDPWIAAESGGRDCGGGLKCCIKKICEEKLGRYSGYCESGPACGFGKGIIGNDDLKDGDQCDLTKICCAENGEENDPCGTDTGAVCSKKPCVNYEGPSSGGRDCEMGLWCCIQAAVKDREEAFKETEKAAPVCGDQEEEDGSDKGVCVKRECKKDAGETWLESNKKDCPGDDMFCCVPPAWIKIEEAEEAAEEAEEAVKAAQKELAECKDEKCKTKANAKLEKAQGDLKKAEAMGEAAEAGESIEDSQDAVDLAKTKVGSLAHIEKERLDAVEKKKKDDIAACENLEKKEKEACKTKANTDAAKAIAGIEAEKVAAQKKLGATKEELEAKEKCPGAPVNIQVLAAEVAKGSSKILKFQQEYNKVVEKCRTSEGVEKEIDEDGYWGPQTEKAKKALCEGKITCDEETQKTAKEERAAAPAAASTAAAAKAVKQAEASVAVAQQKTESKKQEVAKKESEVAAITAELEKLEAECGGGTTEEKPKKEEERAKEGEPCIGSVHGSKLTGTCLGSGLGITVSCAWGESVVAGTEDKCASGLRCCIKNGKVGDPCGSDEGAICTKVDSEGCKKFGGGSGGGSNCDGLGVQCCKP